LWYRPRGQSPEVFLQAQRDALELAVGNATHGHAVVDGPDASRGHGERQHP